MRNVMLGMAVIAAAVMVGDVAQAGLFGRRSHCSGGQCGTTYYYGGGCSNGQCGTTYYAPAPAKGGPVQSAPQQAAQTVTPEEAAGIAGFEVAPQEVTQPAVAPPVYQPAPRYNYRTGRRWRLFR